MLALLAAGVALAVAAAAQDVPAPGSRFVCTALPPEAARAGCPLPAMPAPGGALSPEEELRAAVLQLRETVVQQKETLGTQREIISELTAKLARCEGLASAKAPGRAATGKDTMGDLPRDPAHLVEQLSRSLQTLKDRLESLEVAGRRGPARGGRPGRGGALGPAREDTREWNEPGLGAGGLGPTRVAHTLHPVSPPRAPRLPTGRPFTSRGSGWPTRTACSLLASPRVSRGPTRSRRLLRGDLRLLREVSAPWSPHFHY